MIVSNSSPIITLGKIGRLNLLKKCFGTVTIPRGVHDEVMRKENSPEAAALKAAISEKWITVEKASISPLLTDAGLGEGEKEAVSIAAASKTMLLIDDDHAKAYASLLNVEAHGTLHAIYLAYFKRLISKSEAISIIKDMITNGSYISTELYAKFLELLNLN